MDNSRPFKYYIKLKTELTNNSARQVTQLNKKKFMKGS